MKVSADCFRGTLVVLAGKKFEGNDITPDS